MAAVEKSISKGVKVCEVQITTLTEMLMRQAIKLDAIPAEGDASKQKFLHVIIVNLISFTILNYVTFNNYKFQAILNT